MGSIFNITKDILEEKSAIITAKEIDQQPNLWRETVSIVEDNYTRLHEFIEPLIADERIKIIFSGAGTSEFVGNSIVHYLRKKLNRNIEAISTTDIVASPENYLHKDTKTLLISCARSGNSPESVATVRLAEEIVTDLYQINLTCNNEGALAKDSRNNEKILTLLMPEDSNDKGFAMTGSFTCMSLAGLLIFNLENLKSLSKKVDMISKVGESELSEKLNMIEEIANLDSERIIFLGSSCLKGLAQEASLKTLELSNGKIISDYNSPLGFRHGPKSIVNEKTLIFLFVSQNEYTKKYEIDLVKEMIREGGDKKIVTISATPDLEFPILSHYHIDLSDHLKDIEDDAFLMFNYVLYAQQFAFLKSLSLGNTPDNPCPTGEVNRVVQGVNIYNFS